MPPSRTVSLKDVAARAGVSAMTVSRVLARRSPVSADKQAAVLRAAAELGYQPNPIVQRMMSELRRGHAHGLTANLAFLNTGRREDDWRSLPYLRPCWQGARDRALATGFGFEEIWIGAPGWSARRTFAVLQARGIQGIIFLPGGEPSQVQFAMDGFALAALGGLPFDFPIHQVLPDRFHNFATCYRELWALGYRRIGLFAPDYELRVSSAELLGGFLSAQWQTPVQHHVPVGADAANWQEAEAPFKAWVTRHRPDAVIANYNKAGSWLNEIGLQIPEDIGLVHPGLAADVEGWTGIDPDLYTQGVQTVDLLTAQILRNERGLPATPKRQTIKGRWAPGQTTRPQ